MITANQSRIDRLSAIGKREFPQIDFGASQLISAPGRMEILGNHTDHQRGYVLTASVNLDMLGIAAKNDRNQIKLYSDGFQPCDVDLAELNVVESDRNTAVALIRGVADGFAKRGFMIGGFDACAISEVLKGSGLSSSAAFEVWVASSFNALYNGGRIDPVEIAKICQYAENVHFGKPSGLQDQVASSVGGMLFIDFADVKKPIIEQIDVDFSEYTICVVDSGADHALLTDHYASIPKELELIAAHFGAKQLRDVNRTAFLSDIPSLRKLHGDRAVLRAFHIFEENERVLRAKEALRKRDIDLFFNYVRKSGESSFMYLQNVIAAGNVREQALAVTLALANDVLGERGAFRIQGGGFEGTIEAFVPNDLIDAFVNKMESALGSGCCHILSIRKEGAGLVARP